MTDDLYKANLVPVFRGPRVTLRPWRESDVRDRLAIGRHAEFVRMCGGDASDIQPMTEDEARAQYERECDAHCSWAIEVGGRCIGVTRLHSVRVQDRWAYLAIGLWDPADWGQGLGREATRLTLGHAFETMDLHRVSLRVLAINERAIACYEACGFRREGLERESCHVADQWLDDVMMGVLKSEYIGLSS